MKEIENSKGYKITVEGHVFNSQGQKLKGNIGSNGYEKVTLVSDSGGKLYCVVHRLVATAYIPNPENKPYVNHIDGVKHNNHVDNLEWVTASENMIHAARVLDKGVGENNGNSRYTEETIREVCKLLELGHINQEIFIATGVERHTVSMIRTGKAWAWVSEEYKIPKKSRTFSDSTVRWICRMLEQKIPTKQIIEMSNNPRLTKSMVDDIRIGRVYSDISKEFAI